MKYQWKSIGNKVEIQLKFQWNVNRNPLQIQLKFPWTPMFPIGNPVKQSMKYQWKSSGNSVWISMKYYWNPLAMQVNFIRNFNEIIRFPHRNWRRWGGAELAGFSLGRVDPATLQATKIACAHPPSLSFSGRVCNFRRTGIIVRGYVWGTLGSPDVSIRPSQTKSGAAGKQSCFPQRISVFPLRRSHWGNTNKNQ